MRPSFLFFFLLLLAAVDLVLASPLSLQLGSCSKRATTSTLAFTEGYAQLVPNTLNQRGPTWESGDHLLRVVLLGTSSGVSPFLGLDEFGWWVGGVEEGEGGDRGGSGRVGRSSPC